MMNSDCRVSGPWSWDEAVVFLQSSGVPIRLGVNGSAGFPIVMPLWYMWADESFWLAMKPSAGLVRRLRQDSRCGFDVSLETPPYKGVRGRGTAAVLDDGLPILRQLLERYLGEGSQQFQKWLLSRSKDECAVRIRPETMVSWDFGQRMRD
jgi:nitroimidazol reductase NimA-like FMN-containing flavoprotein (pyridoxamine 5'-phosphate oxidase superfamily)